MAPFNSTRGGRARRPLSLNTIGLALRGRIARACSTGARAESAAAAFSAAADPLSRAASEAVEHLEQRRLFSSITLSGGVLTLNGNASSASKLYVDLNSSGDIYAIADGNFRTIDRSDVRAIKIVGGSAPDKVYVHRNITTGADIRTYGGDDSIKGGAGNDVIDGGDGDDAIFAWGGNDRVLGGDGEDLIYGNDGNDYLDGGDDDDVIFGEVGDDELLGGAGDDRLMGAAGNDLLRGGAGDDDLLGSVGDDTLFGDDGGDSLAGESGADKLDGGEGVDTFPGVTSADLVAAGSEISTPGGGNDDDDDGGGSGGGGDGGGGYTPPGISNNDAIITGAASNSAAPTPVIQLIGVTGVAAHPVHVNALLSTLKSGSSLTARYQWNFGDASGRYNTLEGWNAAHIYDRAGTYTIRLTITNEAGEASTVTADVNVIADARRTIYVDPDGSDENSGLSPDEAVRTAAKASTLLAGNTRLLFKRGERFDIDKSISVNYYDVLIGAYGTGDEPVLNRIEGVGTSIFGLYGEANQVVIQDLTFDSKWPTVGTYAKKISADGIMARGKNIAIRNCEFLNLNTAINSSGKPTGLLVQDNTAPLATGLRSYFVWGQGADHVYIGNTAMNSTREHIVRTVFVDRMLVAYNDFTNLDRSGVDREDYSKGTVEVHKGNYAYVANNELHDGPLRVGPRGGGVEEDSSTTQWTVFENNFVYDHDVQVFPGTHHFMMRNNIITQNGANAISVKTSDDDGRTNSDISIVNNTAITNTSDGQFIKIANGPGNAAVTLKNNLWLAPRFVASGFGAAPVFVYGTDIDIFKEVSNNVWPDPVDYSRYGDRGINYVWPFWSDALGYKTEDEWDDYAQVHDEFYADTAYNSAFTPSSSSVAARAGVPVAGVHTDIYGRSRPDAGRTTAGAVQV